jgi:hypothetical protein
MNKFHNKYELVLINGGESIILQLTTIYVVLG